MYVKLRFYDTKLFNRLQEVYGKQKFITSLEIILEMLKVLNPDDIIRKVLMMSDTEIEMRIASQQIKEILDYEEDLPDIELSNEEEKKLEKEIKTLLSLLDKRLEIHYLSKDPNIANYEMIKEKIKKFGNNMKNLNKQRKKYIKFDNNLKKNGKKKVISNFK